MMTTALAATAFDVRRASARTVATEDDALTRLFAWAARAALRAASRRALARLPDDLLKDVALSRADAERENAKPFWR